MRFVNSLIKLIWVLDIINVPQMEWLDTVVPINGLGWLLIFVFVLGDVQDSILKYKISEKF